MRRSRIVIWSLVLVMAVGAVWALRAVRGAEERQKSFYVVSYAANTVPVTFYSASLKRNVNYLALLPEGKLKPSRVMVLLHGAGEPASSWLYKSELLQARGGINTLIVLPEGGNSYWTNAALKPGERYEDFLIKDLLADVEGRFQAGLDREHRAIGGISMGGYGAAMVALRHPELFAAVGEISGPLDAPARGPSLVRIPQTLNFLTVFGATPSQRKEHDPFDLAQRMQAGQALPFFYVGAGRSDPLFAVNLKFAQEMQSRGAVVESDWLPGGHDWRLWNQQLYPMLKALEKNTAG